MMKKQWTRDTYKTKIIIFKITSVEPKKKNLCAEMAFNVKLVDYNTY
jgi:hypothetical protein